MAGLAYYLFAQTPASVQNYTGWHEEATRLYNLDEPTEQTDSIALQLFLKCANAALHNNNATLAADCFIKGGNIHQTYKRYEFSNHLYHRTLAIIQSKNIDKSFQYQAFLYMGSSFYFSNIIDSAQYYFEAASAISFTYKGSQLPEQELLYNSLGAIYFESANYLQAKNYFSKALSVTPKASPDYNELFVSINSNIANCLLRLNQYDSALKIYKLLQTYPSPEDLTEIIRQNTAHTYFQLGEYDSALLLYRQLPSEDPLNSIKALNDIGRIYMNREQWQQSEVIFDSAIAVNKRISASIKNKEEAKAYLYRGQLAGRQGLFDEAITWCNEALQEIHLNFKPKSFDDLPGDVSQTVSPITLFEILRSKASFLYKKFRVSGQQPMLTASLAAYRGAIQAAHHIKLNFDNDEAKLFFNNNYQLIYGEAIAVAYECCLINNKYFDDYLFILENYKGSILYQNLQNIQLKSTARIPDNIRKREKEIKQLLAFYTSRINNNVTEKDAGQLQKRLLELQVELSRLQKEYDKDESYNLYKNQSSEKKRSLSDIQAAIDNETALINYYMADSVIYLLALTKNQRVVKKINTDDTFKKNLSVFLNETYRYDEGKRYEGYQSSARLYTALLGPVEPLTRKAAKWVIIPDGMLYYLPFEALITDTKTKEYIVEKRVVSYHYSFSLMFQENTHHRSENGNNKILAMAPFSETDDNIRAGSLPHLPYSGQEIQFADNNAIKAVKATKKQFIQNASQYSVIHLATHASIGADSAANWIQFYPLDTNTLNNRLFLPEIYNLDLHRAELIILSACETGGGVTLSGEGLLSLSRAFLYAGSDGIISTLWRTEDQVTAYLMQKLHGYLAKKYSPEKALQLAKIDLLKEKNISAQYKTPNYWSNFIYIGKITPVQRTTYSTVMLALLLIAATVGYFYWQKKKFRPVK